MTTKQAIPIPTEYIGYIIGKSGRTINKLQQNSNTNMFIRRDSFRDEWHYVYIKGKTTDVDKAKKWIISCLCSAIQSKYIQHSSLQEISHKLEDKQTQTQKTNSEETLQHS